MLWFAIRDVLDPPSHVPILVDVVQLLVERLFWAEPDELGGRKSLEHVRLCLVNSTFGPDQL